MGPPTPFPSSHEQLLNLSYKELQHLTKSLGYKANAKKEVLQNLCWTTICDLRNVSSNGDDGPLKMLERNMSPLKQKQGFAARTKEALARVASRVTGSSRARGAHHPAVDVDSAALQDTTNQLHNLAKPQGIEAHLEKLSLADDTAAAPDAGTARYPPVSPVTKPPQAHPQHPTIQSSPRAPSPNTENRPSPSPLGPGPMPRLAGISPQRMPSPILAPRAAAATPSPRRMSPAPTESTDGMSDVMFFPVSPRRAVQPASPAYHSPSMAGRASPALSMGGRASPALGAQDMSLASSASPKPPAAPRPSLTIPRLPLSSLNTQPSPRLSTQPSPRIATQPSPRPSSQASPRPSSKASPRPSTLPTTPTSSRTRGPAPAPQPSLRTSTTGNLPPTRRTLPSQNAALRTSITRAPATKPLRTSIASAPTRSSTPPALRPGASLPDKTRPTLSTKPTAPSSKPTTTTAAASRASLAAAKASRLTSSTTTAPRPTTPRSTLRTSNSSRPPPSTTPSAPKPTTPRNTSTTPRHATATTPSAATTAAVVAKAAALRSSLRSSAASPFSTSTRPTTPRGTSPATNPAAKPTTPRTLRTSISGPVPTARPSRPPVTTAPSPAPASKPTTPRTLRTSIGGSLTTRPKPSTTTTPSTKPASRPTPTSAKQPPTRQPLHTTTPTAKPSSASSNTSNGPTVKPTVNGPTVKPTVNGPTVKPGAFLLAHRGSLFPTQASPAPPTSKLSCLRTAPAPSTDTDPSTPTRSPRATTPTPSTTASALPFSFAPNAPPCTPPPTTTPTRLPAPRTPSGPFTTPIRIPADQANRRLVETLQELEALSLAQQQHGFATLPQRGPVPAPAPPPASQRQPPQQSQQEQQPLTPLRPKALQLDGGVYAPTSHTPIGTPRRVPANNYLPEHELQRLDSLAHSVVLCDPTPVSWRDVCGRDDLKQRLEHLALSTEGKALEKLPRCNTRTVLMFGLPGTGKTMLAHALATELGACVWDVTAAALAKNKDHPERLLRATFQAAARRSQSIILLERLDELLTGRDGSKQLFNEAQTAKIRGELEAQLDLQDDGPRCSPRRPSVLVLALSSRPQALAAPLVAAFGCRVYVPLPGEETREMLLFQLLAHEEAAMNADDLHRIVRRTSGFSCKDVMQMCQYAITSARPQLRASQQLHERPSITLAHFTNALKDPRLRELFTSTDAQLDMERWFWAHGKA